MAVTNYHTINGEIIGETTTGSPRVDYLTDALGSVTATVNQSAQVVNTYRYKPYGDLLAKTGTGADPAFGWVGTKGYRPTTNKFSDFYVRARHADSTTGRWPTEDPLRLGTNLYVYVSSNPVLYTDPSGLVLTRGTGCPDNELTFLQGCCTTFGDMLTKKSGKTVAIGQIIKCMAKKGFTDPTPIMNALGWITTACSSPSNPTSKDTVCIWCGTNEPLLPVGFWPCDINPCLIGFGSDGDPDAGTTRTVDVIGTTGTGSTKKGGAPPCPDAKGGLCPSNDKNGFNECGAIVVMCQTQQTNNECSTFIHELIHAGGLGGAPQFHGQGNGKRSDFIYTLECCICKQMYPKQKGVCGNQC